MDALTSRLHDALESAEPTPGGLERTYSQVAARRRVRRRARAAAATAAIAVVVVVAVVAIPLRPDEASATTVRLPGRILDLAGGGPRLWALTCTQWCDRPLKSRGALTSIDARTGETSQLAQVRSPQAVAVGGGSVWTADFADSTVTHFDAATGERLATIPLVLPRHVADGDREFAPSSLTADESGVWVATARGYVARIDGEANRVDSMLETAKDSSGPLTVAGRAVWLGEGLLIARLDVDSGKRSHVAIEGPGGRRLSVGALSLTDGALWVAGEWAVPARDATGHDDYTVTDDAAIAELDPATGETRRVTALPSGTYLQGHSPGRLWLARPQKRRVYTFDPATRRLVGSARSRVHGTVVPTSSRRAWVVRSAHELARIDVAAR